MDQKLNYWTVTLTMFLPAVDSLKMQGLYAKVRCRPSDCCLFYGDIVASLQEYMSLFSVCVT